MKTLRQLPQFVGSVTKIGLRQDDDRYGFRFQYKGKIPFHPRQIEVLVARTDDEDGIDVGRDQLRFYGFAGSFAMKHRFSN